jgi:hypothetical protein
MLYPEAIAVDEAGRLYVLDLGNQRVVIFAPTHAEPASSAFELLGAASGLCAVEPGVITFGPHSDSLLRFVGINGRVHSQIGTPYSLSRMEELTLARGYLVCARDRGEVVVLPLILPELRAYRIGTGQLLWRVRLPGYTAQLITHSRDRVTITAPPGGYDEARGIHLIGRDIIVVQVSFRKPRTEARGAAEELTTHYFRLSDGRYLGQQSDLPRLVAVAHSIAFFADRTDSATIRGFRFHVAGGP